MPDPISPLALSRRVAVLAGVSVLATACTPYSLDLGAEKSASPRRSRSPRTDPDVGLAAAVVAAEQALVNLIDATLEAHPKLSRVLDSTRAVHEAHVTLLADAAPPGAAANNSPSPGIAEAPADRRIPRNADRALRALVADEEQLSLADKQSSFAAQSGSFARVLASMAAAAAQQAERLRSASVPGGAR